MKPVFLLAATLLRQNRWLIVLLVLYPLCLNAILSRTASPENEDDLSGLIRQEAAYVQAVCIFLPASLIFNERRSRRILSVLSKGISRLQYLTGLLAGVMSITVVYVLSLAVSACLLASQISAATTPIWGYAVMLIAFGLLSASIALFFGAFTHPAVAAILSGAIVSLPLVLAGRYQHATWLLWMPQAQLLNAMFSFSFLPGYRVDNGPVVIALLESGVIYAFAVWIFGRRDLTIASE